MEQDATGWLKATEWLNQMYDYEQCRLDKMDVLELITYSDKAPDQPMKLCFVGWYTCAFCYGNVYSMEHWGIDTNHKDWFWCEKCHSITRLCCRIPMGSTFYDQDAYPAGIKNPQNISDWFDSQHAELWEKAEKHPFMKNILPLVIGKQKKIVIKKRGFPVVPFYLLERFLQCDKGYDLYCACLGDCIRTNKMLDYCHRGGNMVGLDPEPRRLISGALIYSPQLT